MKTSAVFGGWRSWEQITYCFYFLHSVVGPFGPASFLRLKIKGGGNGMLDALVVGGIDLNTWSSFLRGIGFCEKNATSLRTSKSSAAVCRDIFSYSSVALLFLGFLTASSAFAAAH